MKAQGQRLLVFFFALFTIAIVLYPVLWRGNAQIGGHDSKEYMEVAQDLADGHLDQVHIRPPVYPLMILLTGAAKAPNRTLFLAGLGLHLVAVAILAWCLFQCGVSARWVGAFGICAMLPPVFPRICAT